MQRVSHGIRLSYENDIEILGIGKTVADSVEVAQRETDDVLNWSQRNAVTFDILKSEVVQLDGRRRKNPIEKIDMDSD